MMLSVTSILPIPMGIDKTLMFQVTFFELDLKYSPPTSGR